MTGSGEENLIKHARETKVISNSQLQVLVCSVRLSQVRLDILNLNVITGDIVPTHRAHRISCNLIQSAEIERYSVIISVCCCFRLPHTL